MCSQSRGPSPLISSPQSLLLTEPRLGMVKLDTLLIVSGDNAAGRDRDLYFHHLANQLPVRMLDKPVIDPTVLFSDGTPLHVALLAPTYGALIVRLATPLDETGSHDLGDCCVRVANVELPLPLLERMRPLDLEPSVVNMRVLLLGLSRRLERLVMTGSRELALTESLRKARLLVQKTKALGHDTSIITGLLDYSVPACLRAPPPSTAMGLAVVGPPGVAKSNRPPIQRSIIWQLPADALRNAEAVNARRKLNFAQVLPLDKKSELVEVLKKAERQARDIVVLRVRHTMPPTIPRSALEEGIESAHVESDKWDEPDEWMERFADEIYRCWKAYFQLVDGDELFVLDFPMH